MNDFQKKYLLKRQDYGLLYPYLIDDSVTNIAWNGRQLWVDDIKKGHFMASDILSAEFVERLTTLISHVTNQVFGKVSPVMEAETDVVKICVVHASVSHPGTMISFQKIPVIQRLTQAYLVENGYCEQMVLEFLQCCVKAHLSIIICGLPGAGKTELLKYITQYIPSNERVITIEDMLEIHYPKINPNKDCMEMKVAENFSYGEAIRTGLSQNPKWLILSELRDGGAEKFVEAIATGVKGITTIQVDDVRIVPQRIKNMGESSNRRQLEENVHRYLDVGILVSNTCEEDGKEHRRIEQIALYNRYGKDWEEGKNQIIMLMENGSFTGNQLPENIRNQFQRAGIISPIGGMC